MVLMVMMADVGEPTTAARADDDSLHGGTAFVKVTGMSRVCKVYRREDEDD